MSSTAFGATGAIAALPSGVMIDFAGTTAPGGWLMCDGAAVSRTVYAALFTAIGTAYGTGDGSTTFNLPDYRGRFPRYMDNMGTVAGAASRDTGRVLGAAQTQTTAKNGLSSTAASSAISGTAAATAFTIPANGGGTSYGFSSYLTGSSTNTNATGSENIRSITNHSHSISGTAAAQAITMSGDAETRPINLSCNRIIKF